MSRTGIRHHVSRRKLTPGLLALTCLVHPAAGGALELEPCHLEGVSEEALCTSYTVPENRSSPGGERIDLAVSVFPARSSRPREDALVLLAGGPGQGGRDLARLVDTVFRGARGDRDVVLVDLRGTGDSAPLDCRAWRENQDSGSAEELREAVQACAQKLEGRDLARYGHDAALDDLAEVLAFLGYSRVNLWGGSFGTRAALLFASRHPELVRSLILDAPAPASLRFPLYTARDSDAVLARLFEDCAAEAACDELFPELRGTTEVLLDRLAEEPHEELRADPLTGEDRRLVVTRDDFMAALRGWLYVPQHASMIPLVVQKASEGDFGPYLALAAQTQAWSTDTMSLGVTLAVVCSEDVPRITAAEIEELTRGTWIGSGFAQAWKSMCSAWPAGSPPKELQDTGILPMPALILAGELDPVTPPRFGEEMAKRFASSRLVVLPGGGHTVSGAGCLPQLIERFLDDPDPQPLDTSCVAAWKRPGFVLDVAGSSL